jgi:hypothetical protein
VFVLLTKVPHAYVNWRLDARNNFLGLLIHGKSKSNRKELILELNAAL